MMFASRKTAFSSRTAGVVIVLAALLQAECAEGPASLAEISYENVRQLRPQKQQPTPGWARKGENVLIVRLVDSDALPVLDLGLIDWVRQ